MPTNPTRSNSRLIAASGRADKSAGALKTKTAVLSQARTTRSRTIAGVRSAKRTDTHVLFVGTDRAALWRRAQEQAAELEVGIKRVDLSAVASKYIGETEKNLFKVFAAAERSGAILYFDEAEALFGRRTAIKDANDRYANQEVSYLLQRLEEHAGMVIVATNNKSALPPAFLRHFSRVVELPPPKANKRKSVSR